MAHFAEIDDNNVVIRVLVTDNDYPNEGHDWLVENFGGTWVQTSYNGRFRGPFAGIGYVYDAERDTFIQPRPYPSWTLGKETSGWEPPVPKPSDDKIYIWNEELVNWEEEVNE